MLFALLRGAGALTIIPRTAEALGFRYSHKFSAFRNFTETIIQLTC